MLPAQRGAALTRDKDQVKRASVPPPNWRAPPRAWRVIRAQRCGISSQIWHCVGRRSSTSRRHAERSWPSMRAQSTRLITAAARLWARRQPANSQCGRPMAMGRISFTTPVDVRPPVAVIAKRDDRGRADPLWRNSEHALTGRARRCLRKLAWRAGAHAYRDDPP
jgi:hypothetical protein